MAHPELTVDYTSGSGADTTTFASTNPAPNPARQIYAYGAGTVTVVDASGTAGVSRTYTMSGGDTRVGEWTAFTSTTCSRIVMSTSTQPIAAVPAFSTTVPGTSLQPYVNGGATLSAAFNVAAGFMYGINPSSVTFAITFPAINATIDGMKIAIINVSTGSTATICTPTGSDNVGNSAGAATGATAAGPTGGAVKTYTADNTRKAWLVGI
jgi:hypothetical protein